MEDLHLERFNAGDHLGAVAEVARAESISRVLYPADSTEAGQELRLRQEYFFVAASLQDLLRRHRNMHTSVLTLGDHAAIQLNDTHPSIAVAELMRQLVDVYDVAWDAAWQVTVDTLSYTNHTLLPEALETWPVGLMERMLPRHMQIIYLINAQHIDSLRAKGIHDFDVLRAVSLIEEDNGRRVRMGNLAFLGSHSVNGVSGLHTQLMRKTVFAELHKLYPERINNKTNGITFRRWLYQANSELTSMLVDALGPDLLDNPKSACSILNRSPRNRRSAKPSPNSACTAKRPGLSDSRTLGHRGQSGGDVRRAGQTDPRIQTPVAQPAAHRGAVSGDSCRAGSRLGAAGEDLRRQGGGELSPGQTDHQADQRHRPGGEQRPDRARLLKVVFLPNYNVSLAESIIPAADLSEQISTAGFEASGTSNMKFGLNGALTIGTLDGANVEMCERIGAEHMFIFGLSAQQVEARKQNHEFSALPDIAASHRLNDVLQAIRGGVFSPDDTSRYTGLIDSLVDYDRFLVCADFDSYWEAQKRVEAHWHDTNNWWRSAVLNTSRMGWFSSDRTIREYATDIWKALE
jgi:starch phosphorylase